MFPEMVPAWVLLTGPAVVLVVFAACWWGANIVFHPPELLSDLLRPEELDIPYETVEFTTEDGVLLRAWAIRAEAPTDATIVFCHGWGDNKGDMLRRFHMLRKGFNLFFLDTRAHGESAGEHSSIGYLESIDFDAAMRILKERHPNWVKRLGICGLSMGASVAIHAMARHPEIRCGVLESPFRSFNEVVRQFCQNKFKLPYFPFVWLTLAIIRWRLGTDPEPYSPVYHVESVAPRPVFYISGEQDALMPLSEVRALYERNGQPKELWVVPEATHGRCQEVAGEEYDRRVRAFFEEHL
jgi:pimeloyl-ACP methyl ester carboxylesterase